MKKILVILAMIMVSGCASVTNRIAPKKISDSYATSALLALKAIQRDPFAPEKHSQLVSRFTQEKIDAADVAAASTEERNLTNALNTVYQAQLSLNQLKQEEANRFQWLGSRDTTQYTQKQWEALVKATFDPAIAEIPRKKALTEHLDKCYSDFDASLRARSLDTPASCKVSF
jgi:hypothetical protein